MYQGPYLRIKEAGTNSKEESAAWQAEEVSIFIIDSKGNTKGFEQGSGTIKPVIKESDLGSNLS